MGYSASFHSRVLGLCVAGAASAAWSQTLQPVPQADAEQLAERISAWDAARPARPRRVLVFWRCEGFVHGKALEYGNETLTRAGKAFAADLSNDYAVFAPENLAKYDAVVLNNTTALDTREHPFIEPALIGYVQSGKGLAVIHAGADNFYKAERAAEMVGGRFWGHPWGSGGTWAFKLDEPGHPLNRAFGGKGIAFGDEIYQQQSPFYNRAKLRVLVSLDLSDAATAAANGQRRDDKDYAVSWIRPYGKGRVFYTSFGHDQRAFLDKAVVAHILDGIQYAIGDLKADDAPAGLSEADLARVRDASEASANEAFAFLQDIAAHTFHARTEAANRAKLEALLKDTATSAHGKRVILRVMLSMGAPADLAPVAACLTPPETRDWAAALLAGTPGKAAAQSLARALQSPDPALRVTVLNALAIRRDAAAVAPLAADRDPAVAAAALAALGRIGDEEALKTLVKPASAAQEPLRLRALAACLGTLSDQGQARAAVRAAKPLFTEPSHPDAVRAAAARVLLLADNRFFEFGMKDTSPLVRQTVIRAADDVPVNVLADALKTAAPSEQAMLAAKLASRGDAASADAVAALLASEQEAVAVAALQALTRLGAGRHVPAIAALIEREGAVGRSAAETLQDMRAKDAGEALFALAGREPDRQVKLLPVLGERMESALLPRFAPFVAADRAEVRREAWKALGKAADERGCGTLLAWLPQIREDEMNQAEAAVRAAAKNLEPAARASAFVAAWGKAGPPAKRALAALMTGYSDPAFLAPLTGALADPEASVRETALRQLGEWPSMEPFAALKAAVAAQGDTALKQVALRSALKLAAAQGGAGARDRFVELFKAAPDDKGRQSVADAVFRRDGIDLFPLLRGLFDDAACGGAAKALYRRFYDEKLKRQAAQPLREIAPGKWKANASHAGRDASRAFDRKPETRWSSNRGSEKGMWFTLDLGESVFVSEVVLDTERSGNDTPNGYEVFVSADGKAWTGPVAKGDGNHSKKTVIPLSVQTSHLKIVTTGGRSGLHWSIHEITVKAGLDQKKVDEIRAVADAIR